MGSSASKKTGQQKKLVKNNKTSAPKSPETVLLGSSEPPKGPWAAKGAQQAVKGPGRGSVNGNAVNGTQSKGRNHVMNSGANGVKNNEDESKVRPVSSTKRAKSAKAGPQKSLVRQLEKGISNEDTEEIDTIIGLGREKTRLQITREKTKIRREDIAKDKRKKSLSRFQSAANQLKTIKTFDRPMSKEEEMFMGNVGIEVPSTAKVVRIFTSSTFTDTKHERNMLMKEAYPRLKTFCQELGYEFQVVDMRWGVRDQATDDHMGTEICMKELKMCQKLSTGPNFVSLMSHKYGYTDFPRCIEASEFETMIEHVQDKNIKNLFQKWYQKDLNSTPESYVVSSISTKIPDFISSDQEKKKKAKSQWWSESEKMQATLETVATKVFDADKARKYIRSVTETEVVDGILKIKDPEKHCLWLKRNIKDIEKKESNFLLSRYIECTHNNTEEKVKKTRELQKDLTENQMSRKLPATRIVSYDVPWNKETGVDPKDKEHSEYLKKLTDDFVQIMSTMISQAVNEKAKTEDLLVNEIYQHISFCQNKCKDFYGRENTLKVAKEYILGMSNEPLILHGSSGSGKTSVMAMIAKEAWAWMKNKPAIIVRFIGTTPGSSSINSLLSSITQQVRKAYNMNWGVSEDLTVLVDEFQLSLFLASASRPLILILDSLDQLDPSQNARQLQWLPTRLRANVKIIVSTLPEAQYECLPVLKTVVKTQANYLSIPRLPQDDVRGILDKWLSLKHRKLTDDQKKIVFSAFTKCPIPLFLKLSFDAASSWTSFAPKSSIVLEATVRDSINSLFQRLETMHGYVFVSRALGYITTAKNGLTEAELEDILSCDDDILNDVYMYWEPPVRRLPPLLFVRLKADLSQYLVDRGADGVQVIYWYHRQFVEAAETRYCQGEISLKLHAALADYFGGTWANGKKKPYTTAKGDKGEADRHVSSQPIKFGNSYNLRKLNNLPYHRTNARQLDLLKKDCLCNFDFLLNKLKATSLWKIMDDFMLARRIFPGDEMIAKITDVLQLSQHGLLYAANQLAPQILGRLSRSKQTEKFLDECLKYPAPSLIPNKLILTQPGGQLLHSMAGHRAEIVSLDLTADSKTIVTCSDDETIRLWSVDAGKQIRMFDGFGKVSKALFCMRDENILIAMSKKLAVRSLQSGEKLLDVDFADSSLVCLAGENKTLLIVFNTNNADLTDLTEGKTIRTVEGDDRFMFGFPGIACGCKNYAAVTTSDQIYFTVLDVKKQQFRSMYRGFEPVYDTDMDEDVQYEIDEITFSADERQVIYSNIYTNEIVFFDHKAESKVKAIKGNPNDYIRSLRSSKDGKSLYFVNSTSVNFHDIKSGNKTEELEHPVDVVSVCSNDMKTVITAAEDSSVRVWDRTRKVQKISQSPGISAHRIRSICLHENPRYLVGFGFKTRENDSQFVFVYDLMLDKVVRERILDCSILKMELLSTTELLVLPDVERKLKIVNLDSLGVVKEFEDRIPKKSNTFRVVKGRNEVITLSRGKKSVTIHNLKTGKVAAVLETNQKQKLEGLCVDKSGTTLVAFCEEDGPLHIFNLASRKKLCTLNPEHTVFTEGELALTPDGKYLLYTVEAVPPGASKGNSEEIHIEVCDTKTGAKKMSLVDLDFYRKYQAEKIKTGLSSAVDSFQILDNRTVLSTHDDFIVRIFDLSNGCVLHRLKGHLTGVELISNPSSPYLLTYGSWTEENSLRLWDKDTYECIASYTLDRMVYNVNFSSDGKFILACTGKPAEIVTWKFFNFEQDPAVQEQDYPVLFKGQDLEGYLDLVSEETEKMLDDKNIESDSCDEEEEES